MQKQTGKYQGTIRGTIYWIMRRRYRALNPHISDVVSGVRWTNRTRAQQGTVGLSSHVRHSNFEASREPEDCACSRS
jgi:hypothetical protein